MPLSTIASRLRKRKRPGEPSRFQPHRACKKQCLKESKSKSKPKSKRGKEKLTSLSFEGSQNIFELASRFLEVASEFKSKTASTWRITSPFGTVTVSKGLEKSGAPKVTVRAADGPCGLHGAVSYRDTIKLLFPLEQTKKDRNRIIDGMINISIELLTEKERQLAGILLSIALIPEQVRKGGAQALFITTLHMLKDQGLGDFENAQEYFEAYFPFVREQGAVVPNSIKNKFGVNVNKYKCGGTDYGESFLAACAHFISNRRKVSDPHVKGLCNYYLSDALPAQKEGEEENELSQFLLNNPLSCIETPGLKNKRRNGKGSECKIGAATVEGVVRRTEAIASRSLTPVHSIIESLGSASGGELCAGGLSPSFD